jgi:hypothetical protein
MKECLRQGLWVLVEGVEVGQGWKTGQTLFLLENERICLVISHYSSLRMKESALLYHESGMHFKGG